jgi:hypothetical protein
MVVKAALAHPVINLALGEADVKPRSLNVPDDCVGAEDCVDQYLWSIYQRAKKLDTIKVPEQIRMTVKKKGKTRTVTKTIIKLVDEDFTWKDPKAAERAGMSMSEYVIGGMDRGFKMKLYHLLRALDDAGLAPGMTRASAMTTVNRLQAVTRLRPIAHIMAVPDEAATAMGSRPIS